jgi:flagellar motor component MotA
MGKVLVSVLIFFLFIVMIVVPSFANTMFNMGWKASEIIILGIDVNKLYFGVIHIPSLIFILGSMFFLWLSKSKDEEKVSNLEKSINKEFKEADTLINQETYEVQDLQKLFANSQNKYLQELKYLISIGSSEKELEMVIDKYTLKIYVAYEKLKNDYDYIAAVLPMLGMIGTIAGLLQMFGSPTSMGGEDDFAAKFSGLSVALATTLYASLLTVLVVKPASRSVDTLILDTQKNEANIVIKSKLFLHRLDTQVFLEYLRESESKNDEE